MFLSRVMGPLYYLRSCGFGKVEAWFRSTSFVTPISGMKLKAMGQECLSSPQR